MADGLLEIFQTAVVQLGDSHQGADMFGVDGYGGDKFLDGVIVLLDGGIVPLMRFVVILLARRHHIEALPNPVQD